MTNLRIGTRIILGFAIVIGLMLALGLFSISRQSRYHKLTSDIYERDLSLLTAVRNASTEQRMLTLRHQVLIDVLLRAAGLPGDDPLQEQKAWHAAKDDSARVLAELERLVTTYAATAATPSRRAQWLKIKDAGVQAQTAQQALATAVVRYFSLLTGGQLKEALRELPNASSRREDFESQLALMQKLIQEQIDIGQDETGALQHESQLSIVIGLIVASLAGIGCSVFIQRSVTRPLFSFMRFADRVGKGDLTEQPKAANKDELGQLALSLERMVDGLRGMATQARKAADNLGAATAEILASTQQQASSSAEQAAAIQETNTTMAEVTQTGAQISQRAKQVAAAAEATSASSTAGLEAVLSTNSTMQAIGDQAEAVAENIVALSEKTQAVGEIIATVNDIAEQSHLLALNASIEAVTAGEQGRRFAVVASEMKSLADQAKEATFQVRSILGELQKGINSSVMLTEEAVKRVESGRQQAEVAERTMRQLTDNIQQSVQAFQQIVAGSSQQQIGFDQVMQALKNIGIATTQTASSTKQSEQAAANLSALAQELRTAVETYRT